MNYYFGIGLTILSNLLYHILQKSIPGSVNPIGSLIVTYLTAAAACVLLFPLIPGQTPMMAAFKGINWASAALGLAIIGLEAGFLIGLSGRMADQPGSRDLKCDRIRIARICRAVFLPRTFEPSEHNRGCIVPYRLDIDSTKIEETYKISFFLSPYQQRQIFPNITHE
jgi:hypothetical protein